MMPGMPCLPQVLWKHELAPLTKISLAGCNTDELGKHVYTRTLAAMTPWSATHWQGVDLTGHFSQQSGHVSCFICTLRRHCCGFVSLRQVSCLPWPGHGVGVVAWTRPLTKRLIAAVPGVLHYQAAALLMGL